jgi:hypothetical protein
MARQNEQSKFSEATVLFGLASAVAPACRQTGRTLQLLAIILSILFQVKRIVSIKGIHRLIIIYAKPCRVIDRIPVKLRFLI